MRTEPASAATTSLPPSLLAPSKPPVASAPASIILFGRDERGRPHASRFGGEVAEGAGRAAQLMGLHHANADAQALRELAAQLPAGRLFPSGKALVPFCSAKLYTRLLAATGTADTPLPLKAAGKPPEAPPPAGAGSGGKGSPDGAGGAPKAPSDWASIGIGSTVLACQGPMEGWFEAVVRFTKSPDSFVLVWRDWPLEPEIVRARKDLGLMPPGSREGLG